MSWDNCWVGKKRRKVWHVASSCLFWSVWKARNGVAFRDKIIYIYRLKISFVPLLWAKTKLFIVNGPSTLIEFVKP